MAITILRVGRQTVDVTAWQLEHDGVFPRASLYLPDAVDAVIQITDCHGKEIPRHHYIVDEQAGAIRYAGCLDWRDYPYTVMVIAAGQLDATARSLGTTVPR